MVFRELKITTDGRNIGPYTTASLSIGYLKDTTHWGIPSFCVLPNKLFNKHLCFPVRQFLEWFSE